MVGREGGGDWFKQGEVASFFFNNVMNEDSSLAGSDAVSLNE